MKCLKCSDKIKKRQVLCLKDWSDLAAIRKEAIRMVYGRGVDQMKLIDMLINGDVKTVTKIVADKDVRIESFKSAKVTVDLSALPPEEVKVIYKKVKT